MENQGLQLPRAAGSAPAACQSRLNRKRCGREGPKSVFSTRKLVVPCVSSNTIASWPSSALTQKREEKVSCYLGFCISAACLGPWLRAARGRRWLHWCVRRDGLKCLCMEIRNKRTPRWGGCMEAALQLLLLVGLRANTGLIPVWSTERGDCFLLGGFLYHCIFLHIYLFPQRVFQWLQKNLDTIKYTAKVKAEVLW